MVFFPDLIDDEGKTLINVAESSSNIEIVEYLKSLQQPTPVIKLGKRRCLAFHASVHCIYTCYPPPQPASHMLKGRPAIDIVKFCVLNCLCNRNHENVMLVRLIT